MTKMNLVEVEISSQFLTKHHIKSWRFSTPHQHSRERFFERFPQGYLDRRCYPCPKVAENAPEQLPSAAWHSLPQELQDLARPEAKWRPHTTDFPQKVAFWKGNHL